MLERVTLQMLMLQFGLMVTPGYLESTTNSFTADTWYHIAATYDGATMRLYINGNLESSVAASKNFTR